MEENSTDSTDHGLGTGCGDYTIIERNAILRKLECKGCGVQYVQTRPNICLLVVVLGVLATGAFFTSGGLFTVPELSAEANTMLNTVFGTTTGIATAWFVKNGEKAVEINVGDER